MTVTTETLLDTEKEYEIVDGQPVEKVSGGAKHSGVGARLSARIGMHCEANNLGGLYGPDTTFKIGQNDRLPDVSFVAAARIPPEGEPETMWPFAPDLAIEILSPNDLYEKVNSKMREYFDAGVREVWLISPEHKMITIYHSPTQTTILTENDELTSEELLPGFRCRISEIFKTPSRT